MDDTTPNVAPITGMPNPVPQVTQPPPQVTQAQPAAPQPTPQQASIQHDTLFGRAAKTLMGQSTQYSVDQNGNTVATKSPGTFNSLAKNILSAAILGAAAGANGNPAQGFAGGAARGGAAEVNNLSEQDKLKRAQAQQQFQNQQAAAREQREASAAVTQDQLRKAQIAQANAETYRTNVLTQGTDFTQHNDVAKNGLQHFSDYEAAGLKPVFKDVSETDMQTTLKNRPGASTYDWEPTGVKVGFDPKTNQPTHEYTYSAYDPKGTIPVSQGTIDQWKKDGMDKFYPELFNVVKAGKQLDATQYLTLKKTDEKLYNDTLTRQKNEQSSDKVQAEIKESNAAAAAHYATAAHERAATGQIQEEKTKQQALSNAFDELNKVGGDFDRLTPKSKVIIGGTQATLIPSMTAEYKQILADDPGDSTGKAKEILTQIDGIRNLSMQAIKHGAAVPQNGQGQVMLNPQGQQVLVTPDKMDAAVKAGYKKRGLLPQRAGSPETAYTDQTVLKGPNGNIAVANPTTFIQQHPEYKIVGPGKLAPEQAPQNNGFANK